MPQIGTFTHDDDGIGFVGHLTTLMLAQDILIVAAEPSDAENAPQYRVHIVDGETGEAGAETPRTRPSIAFISSMARPEKRARKSAPAGSAPAIARANTLPW